MTKALLALMLCFFSFTAASAATIDVTFGERVYALDVAKVCGQRAVTKNGYQLPVLRNVEDGTLMVGTQSFPQYVCARKMMGGGGSTTIAQGKHTGQTAEEVAADLGLPPGSVGTIDPGPVVAHNGVQDTNGNGTSNDEADAVTAEGATQSDAQPSAGTSGDTTNGGNNGVDIF